MQPADTSQERPPYQALSAVYDQWTAGNNYEQWVQFYLDEWAAQGTPVQRVLELCCGTGTIAGLLAARGKDVVGVDRSPEMLERARAKLGDRVRLVHGELPDVPVDMAFDAAICAFDSLNYLPTPAAFAETLQSVARCLRPGGVFIFDLNTRKKLQDIFGSSHYGDDLGTFAYVWRNRFDAAHDVCHFLITLFVERDGLFQRWTEHHQQRIFDPASIRVMAEQAGFSVRAVFDDYSQRESSDATLRETWVLARGNNRSEP